MEEKIYDRQVTKETLSQRVIDEHQIDRHFTAADLRELYVFKPDRLDDPSAPKRPIPSVPKVCCSSMIHSFKRNNFGSTYQRMHHRRVVHCCAELVVEILQ